MRYIFRVQLYKHKKKLFLDCVKCDKFFRDFLRNYSEQIMIKKNLLKTNQGLFSYTKKVDFVKTGH